MSRAGATSTHAWSSSAYPGMAPNLLPAIDRLVEFAGVGTGDLVLDAGCGTGNVALTAHRIGADVVGLDLTRGMLEMARDSAAVVGADDLDWVQGDVSHLPFRDGAFDATLSSFGHVFAPDVAGTARELIRVTAAGGTIAFASWSPYGVVGALAELAAEYVTGGHDPTAHLQWGRPDRVQELLDGVDAFDFRHGEVTFRFVSPAHFWRQIAEESGPLVPAVEELTDEHARRAMREEALGRVEEFFQDNAVGAEYLLARGTVR